MLYVLLNIHVASQPVAFRLKKYQRCPDGQRPGLLALFRHQMMPDRDRMVPGPSPLKSHDFNFKQNRPVPSDVCKP